MTCDARHIVRLFARQLRITTCMRGRRLYMPGQKQYGASVPTIVLNGESRPIQAGQTVLDLLQELGLDPRQVAVERNREVVPRAEHGQAVLADGDQLEVVTFVGGG